MSIVLWWEPKTNAEALEEWCMDAIVKRSIAPWIFDAFKTIAWGKGTADEIKVRNKYRWPVKIVRKESKIK
jgi:hypothetical protein